MLRVRDAGLIGEAGTFQKNKADELEKAFQKLNTDINALRESYNGAGAEANINAFIKGADNFKNVIEKIRGYGAYQEGVFNHDSENIQNTSKEVNALLTQPLVEGMTDPMLTKEFITDLGTLDASSLGTGGDNNA